MDTVNNSLFGCKNSYLLNNQFHEIQLTSRESECLFFTLRGKTSKEIGKILTLTPRTVEGHLEDIFEVCGFKFRKISIKWGFQQRDKKGD